MSYNYFRKKAFSLEKNRTLLYNIRRKKKERKMEKFKYCIGVDLGGTNIATGLVDLESKSIVRQHSIKTNAPCKCEEIARDIVGVCNTLCSEEGITFDELSWIGVATPGIVKDDVVISAFNLGWNNAQLGKNIRELTNRPAYIANDANAAAYAEAVWGAGMGKGSLIAFTLGTGVGGGIVFDGKIWEGMNGFAAELGHVILERNGRPCTCGKRGCMEAYCSATALIKDTKAMMEKHPESSMWTAVGGDINRVNGKTSFNGMRNGDKAAKLVIDNFLDNLAYGISNIINIFQPDVVCIGGGISREGDELLLPLRERVVKNSFGAKNKRTEVVAASFRNDAGIIGAALLGLQNI